MKKHLVIIYSLCFVFVAHAQKSEGGGDAGDYAGVSYVGSGMGGHTGRAEGSGSLSVPELNFGSSACPFKESNGDLSSYWSNTRTLLQSLVARQEQMNQSCPSLATSTTALQSALDGFLEYSDFSHLDCDNYEVIFAAELQTVETIARRGTSPYYITDYHVREYYSYCSDYYDSEVNSYQLSEFISCVNDFFDGKSETKEAECVAEGHFANLEEEEAKFNEYMQILPQIQQAVQGVVSSAGTCSDEGLRQAALVSVFDLTTTLTSTAIGGLGGVIAAFTGGIIIDSIKALFSRDRYRDIRSMQSEDEYNDLACFYFQSQRMYCDYQNENEAQDITSCYSCQRDQAARLLPNDFLRNALELQNLIGSSQDSREQLINSIHEKLGEEIEEGKTLRDYLLNDVLTTLYREDQSKKEELRSFILAVDRAKEHFDTPLTAEQILMGAEREERQLGQDIETILRFDMPGVLHQYQNTIGDSAEGFELLESVDRLERAREMTLTPETGFNYAMWSQATGYFVNSTKDIFTDQLETHFNTARDNHGNFRDREIGFSYIAPLLRDCILAQGVQFIPESNGTNFSANVERSAAYERYCAGFECGDGRGLSRFNTHLQGQERDRTREYYNRIQCLNFDSYPILMKEFADNYKNTGKICGRESDEFFSARRGR